MRMTTGLSSYVEENPFEDSFNPLKPFSALTEGFSPLNTPPINLPFSLLSSPQPAPFIATPSSLSITKKSSSPLGDSSPLSKPSPSSSATLPPSSAPSSLLPTLPPSKPSLLRPSQPALSSSPLTEKSPFSITLRPPPANEANEAKGEDPHHGLHLLVQAEIHAKQERPAGQLASPDDDIVRVENPTKRLRRATKDMSAEEKRKIYLERNKMAASKCRQRKKQWLVETQSKAQTLKQRTVELEEGLRKLKAQQELLFDLVLRHKDCGFPKIDEFILDKDAIEQGFRDAQVPLESMYSRKSFSPSGGESLGEDSEDDEGAI